jgi:hypothetical protein
MAGGVFSGNERDPAGDIRASGTPFSLDPVPPECRPGRTARTAVPRVRDSEGEPDRPHEWMPDGEQEKLLKGQYGRSGKLAGRTGGYGSREGLTDRSVRRCPKALGDRIYPIYIDHGYADGGDRSDPSPVRSINLLVIVRRACFWQRLRVSRSEAKR